MKARKQLFEWGVQYATGIESIDNQHRRLVNMINALQNALEQGYSVSIMVHIFDEIAAYTVYHFGHEEQLFAKFGYPEEAEHGLEHQRLKDQALAMRDRLKAGDAEIGPELLEFLVRWLQNHIVGSDMRYVDFLKVRGVK